MADDAGRDDLGRAVDDAADDRFGRDRTLDRSARVDALEDCAVERPGCDWKYHQGMPFWAQIVDGARPEDLAEARCQFGQA